MPWGIELPWTTQKQPEANIGDDATPQNEGNKDSWESTVEGFEAQVASQRAYIGGESATAERENAKRRAAELAAAAIASAPPVKPVDQIDDLIAETLAQAARAAETIRAAEKVLSSRVA